MKTSCTVPALSPVPPKAEACNVDERQRWRVSQTAEGGWKPVPYVPKPTDMVLARLLAEAAKTGEWSKVFAYKQHQQWDERQLAMQERR